MEDLKMRKIYCHPNSKVILFMPEKVMDTDTTGNLLYGNRFSAREDKYFDEDNDNDSKKSFWDE